MTSEPVILGDWGSTRLRLWLRHGGTTLAFHEAPGLLVAERKPALILREALDELSGRTQASRIVLCGMAGARGALAEAGYVPCPGNVDAWVDAAMETFLDGFRVTILPGFSSRDRNGRADVMRGEEAQVFGALALPEAGGAREQEIVLPGTHSKWVGMDGHRIMRFATCPTGELHARLIGSSLAPDGSDENAAGHDEGFAIGTSRARAGEALIGSLFEARAAQLLDGRTGSWSRGFLSGLLIGSEVAAMIPRLISDAPPLLIGSPRLAGLYRKAFESFERDCRTLDGELCALQGLEAAHARIG